MREISRQAKHHILANLAGVCVLFAAIQDTRRSADNLEAKFPDGVHFGQRLGSNVTHVGTKTPVVRPATIKRLGKSVSSGISLLNAFVRTIRERNQIGIVHRTQERRPDLVVRATVKQPRCLYADAGSISLEDSGLHLAAFERQKPTDKTQN